MASTPPRHDPEASARLRWTAAVIWAGITYFVVALIALHVLRPDLDPLAHPTSQYAVGPYGLVMASAFLSMSTATFALVVGLRQGGPASVQSRVGLTLLGVWGVAVLVAMLFPLDPVGSPPTTSGLVHRINGPIGFLSLTVGAMLVSWSFRGDPNWRSLHRPTWVLSLAMLAGFVIMGVNAAAQTGLWGLSQRTLLILVVAWYGLTATHLSAIVRGRRAV